MRACTASAREVVPGSAALSTMRTFTPRWLSHSASTRPVGPAPTIKTSISDPLGMRSFVRMKVEFVVVMVVWAVSQTPALLCSFQAIILHAIPASCLHQKSFYAGGDNG